MNTWSYSISICFFRTYFYKCRPESMHTGSIFQGLKAIHVLYPSQGKHRWENDYLKMATLQYLHFISGGNVHSQNPRDPSLYIEIFPRRIQGELIRVCWAMLQTQVWTHKVLGSSYIQEYWGFVQAELRDIMNSVPDHDNNVTQH